MPIGITKLQHRHAKITKERIWDRDTAPDLDPFQGRLHKVVWMLRRAYQRGLVRPGTRYGAWVPRAEVSLTICQTDALHPAEVEGCEANAPVARNPVGICVGQ